MLSMLTMTCKTSMQGWWAKRIWLGVNRIYKFSAAKFFKVSG